MSFAHRPDLKDKARTLRKESTPWERKLWYEFLSTYPLRFQRQKMIGPYIVDFYCAKAELVIELDGPQHYESAARVYDADRTGALQSKGLTVLRFTNIEIATQFESVCAAIDGAIPKK